MDNEFALMITVASIVFFAAIILIFSQEFGRMLKKIFAIKGAKLFLPLIMASWLIELFEEDICWGLLWLSETLYGFINKIASFIPFTFGYYIAQILSLIIVTSIPVGVAWFERRNKPISKVPRSAYYVSGVFWLVTVFLIIQPTVVSSFFAD